MHVCRLKDILSKTLSVLEATKLGNFFITKSYALNLTYINSKKEKPKLKHTFQN